MKLSKKLQKFVDFLTNQFEKDCEKICFYWNIGEYIEKYQKEIGIDIQIEETTLNGKELRSAIVKKFPNISI